MDLIYCVKCRNKTTSKDEHILQTSKGSKRISARCCIINSEKSQLLKLKISLLNFFLLNGELLSIYK